MFDVLGITGDARLLDQEVAANVVRVVRLIDRFSSLVLS